jgi:hypothetical protein
MSGKGNSFETVKRINDLAAFLAKKEETGGASIGEIMEEVYKLPLSSATRRMFNRDLIMISKMHASGGNSVRSQKNEKGEFRFGFRSNETYVPTTLPESASHGDKLPPEEEKTGKEYNIKLRLTGNFALTTRQTRWFEGDSTSVQKDGSVIYSVRMHGLETITPWIMRYLDCIEIIEPRELRDEIDHKVDAYMTRRKNRRS